MKKTIKATKKIVSTDSVNAKGEVEASAPDAVVASASAAAAPSATVESKIPAQLQAIAETCGFGDPYTDEDRRKNERLVQRMPDEIVSRIIAIADRQNDVVAGITFDANAAKSALAQADDAEAIAAAGQLLVNRARDQATRLRAGVTGSVSAIRTAMRGYAKTAQGGSLQSENDEIRAIVRQAAAAAKARRTRTQNAVEAATSATEASAPVVSAAAAPAPAVTTPVTAAPVKTS